MEATYNVTDGYIIFTHIQMPNTFLPADNPRGAALPELVSAIWKRLHAKYTEGDLDPHTGAEKRLGAWMFVKPGMSRTTILNMRDFLNYIFFQVPQGKDMMDVIGHCFFHNNVRGITMPLWKHRVTFRVGHW